MNTEVRLLDQIQDLRFPARLPSKLLEVAQRFEAPEVEDVASAVRAALNESGLLSQIQAGASVGIAAGSRGIHQIPQIIRAVVDVLREIGACPFVFTAMGSHGGATAEGQLGLLAELGVTPDRVGAEVRATMEATEIGQVPGGPMLYQDVISAAADHVLLVNRIKLHTDFRGELESGLAKMAVIGLGKQVGSETMHRLGATGFARYLAPAARIYEAHTNVLGGLAIIENAHSEVAYVEALTSAEIGGPREVALQVRAKDLMPSLPFPVVDVLIVRQLGKDISGTGLDTNVIGRIMIPRLPEPADGPDVAIIAVLDVTQASHGNATGIGLANLTTARLLRKLDLAPMYTNGVTTGSFGMWRNHLPIIMADDRRTMEVAMRGCGEPPEIAQMVLIQDTRSLDRMWVSPSLREEVMAHPRLSLVGEVPLSFSENGVMTAPWQMD